MVANPLSSIGLTTKETAMNAIVVYDSLRGNTQLIASTVAEAMAPLGDVRVYRVDQVPVGVHADAWVVGGPTHAHGLSKPLSAFLTHLERDSLKDLPVATFDTRYHYPRLLSGSAAHSAAGQLRRAGGHMVAEPASFFVEEAPKPAGSGKPDPAVERLLDGELARARVWGASLVDLLRS
jgi:flavodoxin